MLQQKKPTCFWQTVSRLALGRVSRSEHTLATRVMQAVGPIQVKTTAHKPAALVNLLLSGCDVPNCTQLLLQAPHFLQDGCKGA